MPVRTFVAKTLPGFPSDNPTRDGICRATWPYGDGTKHTHGVYIPTLKKTLFTGTDHNNAPPCDNHLGNHGWSMLYDAGDGPNGSWLCVGGACRAAGQESPCALDEAPTHYRPADNCVYTSAAASGEMNHISNEVICTCGETAYANGAPLPEGVRSSGSMRRIGAVWKIDTSQSTAGSPNWVWQMLLHTGLTVYNENEEINPPGPDPAHPYNENQPPLGSGTIVDPVTDKAISLHPSRGFVHLPFPLTPDSNPANVSWFLPRDPDSPNNCTAIVSSGVSGNRFALDPIGRWAYFFQSGSVMDPAICDNFLIDPRLVTSYTAEWTVYIFGQTFVSANQFSVGGSSSILTVGLIVELTCSGGIRTGRITVVDFQPGPNITVLTVGELTGPLDAGLSALRYDPKKTLNPARFYRYHLDLKLMQKLPDPTYRVYAPSASINGGPYNYHGYTSEIDCHWDSNNRAVLHLDHGLGGPDGPVETGMWVWDTTLRITNTPPIRQYNSQTGVWDNLSLLHAGAWQNFPTNSTEPSVLVNANEEFYDPGQNVLLIGGGPAIQRIYHWRYR